MKNEYIIMYGYKYNRELYAIATSIKESKQFIKECQAELGIDYTDIICYKVIEKAFDTTTTVNFK